MRPDPTSKDMGDWPRWHVVTRYLGWAWSDSFETSIRVTFEEAQVIGAPNEERVEETVQIFARLRGLIVLDIDMADMDSTGFTEPEVGDGMMPYIGGAHAKCPCAACNEGLGSRPVSDCIGGNA
jgi:hypothetical protein